MRNLLILAVAAFLAVGCAGRNEDETGAAPDQGDATVTATDTSATVQTDSTMGQTPSDSSFVQQDTTASDTTDAEATGWPNRRPMGVDSVGAQGEVETGDTTATGTWTDSTAAGTADTSSTPADTTAAQ